MSISQREARRLRKRVEELEDVLSNQRRRWATDWPGGTNIWTTTGLAADKMASLRTAQVLRHAVVVVPHPSEDTVRYYALPVAKP